MLDYYLTVKFDDLPLNGDQGTSDDTITQEAVLRLAAAAICAVEKYANKE